MENVFAVSHVSRKPENDPKTKMKRGIFHNHQKTHQFQNIKSNEEVTPKTRETYFLYRKPQKLNFVKNVFENCLPKVSLHAVSCIVPKVQKVGSYCRNNKLGVAF